MSDTPVLECRGEVILYSRKLYDSYEVEYPERFSCESAIIYPSFTDALAICTPLPSTPFHIPREKKHLVIKAKYSN
jgi:hypothetical protein